MTKVLIYPVSTPWVYHHEWLGLISFSRDGINWTTIADKNLWATQVYNNGDVLNNDNCWYLYQWGNNYGFPRSKYDSIQTSNIQVDTTGYGPWNYYDNNIFIIGSRNWSSINNLNLWGHNTGTFIAMQGPCPNDYHIPTSTEWEDLITLFTSDWGWGLSGADVIKDYLKMPCAWNRRYQDGDIFIWWAYWEYWSTTPNLDSTEISFAFVFAGVNIYTTEQYRWVWNSIRPFKNTPVQPDTSRTVLYQPN